MRTVLAFVVALLATLFAPLAAADPGIFTQPLQAGAVVPERYGTVGNGTTDDTVAAQRTITAAGVNGEVRWTPNKTYLISSQLVPLEGQTWSGYGAKLKRANAVTTTLTAGLSGGQDITAVPIAVTSTASFRVGQQIRFKSTAAPTVTFEVKSWTISAKSPTTLTLTANSPLLLNSYSVGDTVTTDAFPVINGDLGGLASGLRILGLEIDGNRTNNPHGIWQTSPSMLLGGDRVEVRDCYIHDSSSDAIEYTGNYGLFADNWIISSGGNGIHLGAATGNIIRGNHVLTFMLNGVANGHADGGIIASVGQTNTTIVGNDVDNAGNGSGWICYEIGDNYTDLGTVLTGNYGRNCATAFNVLTVASQLNGRAAITGNTWINAGTAQVQGVGAPSYTNGVTPIVISGNSFESTGLYIISTAGIAISGNSFWKTPANTNWLGNPVMLALIGPNVPGAVVSGNTLWDTSTTAAAIYIPGVSGISITGNTIQGFSYGIYGANAGSNYPVYSSITANTLIGQYTEGIYLSASAADNVLANNSILALNGTHANGYTGIDGCIRCLVTGNVITIGNECGNCGIRSTSGSSSATGAIITNNKVMAGCSWPVTAGGYEIVDANFLQNSGGGGSYNGGINVGAHATIGALNRTIQ